MKTCINNLLLLPLLLAVPAAMQAQLTYTTNNGAITITGYNGGGAISIPSTLNGYPVTSIGPKAFQDSDLTSVTIPNSVTNIGDEAFDDSVLLTAITVNSGNPAYISVSGILFNKSQTTLIEYPPSKNGASYFSYTIPSSVTNIGDGAFDGCGFLSSVTIGTNVISIGASAFFLTSLTSITIPSSVTSIGAYAFEDCELLTSVYFDGNAPNYGMYAFETHANTTVYYYWGTSGWGSTYDGLPTVLVNPPPPPPPVTYTTNNGTITITGYTGSGGGLTIPSTINGLTVTSIGDYAFFLTPVTSVTIPNSVTNIGDGAFFQASLTNATIGSGVTSIGDGAFGETELTSVTIPNSVTSIGDSAFDYCTHLTGITVNTGNPAYSSVAGVLFNQIQTKLIQYPAGKLGTVYTIPNSVTSIGDYAFGSCSLLTSVTIPNSVISIGDAPFVGCTSLTTITVNTSNPAYSSVAGILFNQIQTTLVEYPAGIRGSYTIPSGVTSIGDDAFDSSSLTGVTIPNSVTSIGDGAFESCDLTSVTIPNGVTSIGDYTFVSCSSLTNVTIPNSVTSIGDYAFESCWSLTSVTIPNSVTSIGSWAFGGCAGLTNATIGSGVISIGDYAFDECKLTYVTIPNSVTSIGDSAFESCDLTSVTIPDSVTNIWAGAFADCPSLTSVTVGNSVASIGTAAFALCPSLTSVYFSGNAPSANSTLFNLDKNVTVYYLSGNTGWASTFAGFPAVMLNASNPTLTITSPVSGQSWSNNVFIVTGTASDELRMSSVWFQVNSNGWQLATTSNNWTNWTAAVALLPGTNTIAAYAVEVFGIVSVTNTVSLVYVSNSAILAVSTNGVGSLSTNYNGASLQIGNIYAITATAGAGFVFTNWTGGTSLPLTLLTNGPTVLFVMKPNLMLQANFVDLTRPTISITNVPAGLNVSNAAFTLKGTTSDNWKVANVFYSLNSGGWSNAVTANNWTNWTAAVALVPGTNTVSAYAVDPGGEASLTTNASLFFVVTNQLQIRAIGLGTISPNYSNTWLQIGRNYSITSAPASGFVFTNWIISTNWIGGTTTSKTNLMFTMASNMTLLASFVETSNPTLLITAPANLQKMTNALATVTGTTSDKWAVSDVWYQLNNGAWNASATTNGWTNWITTVELISGTNTVKAYAMNLGGNFSTTNSVSMVSSNTFMLQLVFTNALPMKTNGLVFNLQLSTGLNGHIQVSTNLTSWATLTNFVGSNTTITFLDPAATNSSHRFYRAVVP